MMTFLKQFLSYTVVMSLVIAPQPVPLTENEHGDICVTGTRIGLEDIVEDYHKGRSPEEIVLAYPTLKATDVYSVISYYLKNRDEVDAYIQEQYRRADEVKERLGINKASEEFKKTLLERQARRVAVK
jgi:uncharacterized protein (DUF433 family)